MMKCAQALCGGRSHYDDNDDDKVDGEEVGRDQGVDVASFKQDPSIITVISSTP